MAKKRLGLPLLAAGLAASAAGIWAAKRVVDAPADPALLARADTAAHSGPWTHGYADVNGVRLHYAEVGSGPLVILLHGFPECWYQWHYIMPRLASHFRLVAPDMRGYNLSDKPQSVEEYTLDKLGCDIAQLIDALGEERAHIVGHDWGGIVAWYVAQRYPNHVDKLVVINAPHPAAFEREIKKPEQMLRSSYVLFFQLPLLPEAVLRLMIRSLPASAAIPRAFTNEALDVYQCAVSLPGSAKAMIDYYRAIARAGQASLYQLKEVVTRPTLLLWGMKDQALTPALTEGLELWVTDLHVRRVEESGHWLPEEKPGLVSDSLLEFFLED